MAHNVTEIQQRLIALGYLPALRADGKSAADGTFGTDTLAAYNRFRASKGEGPHTGLLLLTEISADVFPEDAPPRPVPLPSILDIFKTATALNKGDFSMIPASALDYLLNFLQSKIVWAAGLLVVAVDTFVSTHWGLALPADVNAWITTGLVTAGGAVIMWLRTFANKPKVVDGQVVAK